jgi:hypothetical protein
VLIVVRFFAQRNLCKASQRFGSGRMDARLFDWEPEAECLRKMARNERDPCGARRPDLSKVL